MIELDPERPTHFVKDGQKLTQIDRVMSSTPQWKLLHWNMTATVPMEPERLDDGGIADHAPVQVVFYPRRRRPPEDQ
eukprot:9480918-Pyramimonas_sp.AAC.1